jgi:pimeloyl-ACP methyl ester carboxylesterase
MTTKIEHLGPSIHREEIWFDSDGVRPFALDLGRGYPVGFLHGGLANHQAAPCHVKPLATTHRLVVPDFRGSGRSFYTGELS